MKIITIGNPVLRKKARAVHRVTSELLEFAESMEALMHPTGVGLAAPQVGRSEAFFIYDVGEGLRLIINPQILEHKGVASDEEGCLSVPGVWAPVERATEIALSFVDRNGRRKTRRYTDFEARVIQHEYDHLQGVLFVDHVTDPATISVQENSPLAGALVQPIDTKERSL